MAAPRPEKAIPAAAAATQGPPPAARILKVYHRCFKRHARVLDAKISKLEMQLKEELSKNSDGYSSSEVADMTDRIEKIRSKREAIYAADELLLERNQQKN